LRGVEQSGAVEQPVGSDQRNENQQILQPVVRAQRAGQ